LLLTVKRYGPAWHSHAFADFTRAPARNVRVHRCVGYFSGEQGALAALSSADKISFHYQFRHTRCYRLWKLRSVVQLINIQRFTQSFLNVRAPQKIFSQRTLVNKCFHRRIPIDWIPMSTISRPDKQIALLIIFVGWRWLPHKDGLPRTTKNFPPEDSCQQMLSSPDTHRLNTYVDHIETR